MNPLPLFLKSEIRLISSITTIRYKLSATKMADSRPVPCVGALAGFGKITFFFSGAFVCAPFTPEVAKSSGSKVYHINLTTPCGQHSELNLRLMTVMASGFHSSANI